MRIVSCLTVLGAFLAIAALDPARALARNGWGTQIDGIAAFQGSAALSGGGEFKSNRSFLRASSLYRFEDGASLGLGDMTGVGRMKIAVMGSGGLGGLFGGLLAKSGVDITFVARGAHLAAMQSSGLRIQSDLGSFSLDHVHVVDNLAGSSGKIRPSCSG